MKNILVFLSCVLIFLLCSCAQRSGSGGGAGQGVGQNHGDVSKGDSEYAYIKIENFNSSVEFDDYNILLYEENNLQTFSKNTIESKKFTPGTNVKVGVVFYKDGKKVAETNDSKDKCKFTTTKLTAGSNSVSVVACDIVNPSEQDNDTCDKYQEMYSKCVFQDSINNNDSFYSKAIENIGSCSNLSEIICYKKDNSTKVVILACISQDKITTSNSGSCLTTNNKLILSKTSYSAIRIGEVQIL